MGASHPSMASPDLNDGKAGATFGCEGQEGDTFYAPGTRRSTRIKRLKGMEEVEAAAPGAPSHLPVATSACTSLMPAAGKHRPVPLPAVRAPDPPSFSSTSERDMLRHQQTVLADLPGCQPHHHQWPLAGQAPARDPLGLMQVQSAPFLYTYSARPAGLHPTRLGPLAGAQEPGISRIEISVPQLSPSHPCHFHLSPGNAHENAYASVGELYAPTYTPYHDPTDSAFGLWTGGGSAWHAPEYYPPLPYYYTMPPPHR